MTADEADIFPNRAMIDHDRRLPAIYGHPLEIREGPLVRSNES